MVLRHATRPAALVAFLALQVSLIVYFEPPGLLFSAEPVSRGDIETHIDQTWRVTEALDRWGKSWVYDPQLLAGYPTGTVFDADNKGWELWTFALWKLGLPRGLAFNLFIIMAHMLVPWIVFAAARLFRLGWWESMGAAAFAMSCWYFDVLPHRFWLIGMVSYVFAGVLFLLPIALMYRYTEDGGWWRVSLLAVCMAIGHLVHPYVFIMLVGPMLAMYIRAFRSLGWRRHVALACAALFTIGVNAYWLIVAFRFWHHILDSSYYGQSTLSYVVTDFLGLVRDPNVTGYVANRTGFRILVFVPAIVTLFLWRGESDRRFLPFATALTILLGLTYFGGYFWLTRQVQPYRFLAAAIFLSAIPAGAFLSELRSRGALRRIPRLGWTLVAVVLLIAIPHLARDVIYFVPDLVPDEIRDTYRLRMFKDRIGAITFSHGGQKELRRSPPPEDFTLVAEWLDENDDGRGRVLVQAPFLGEHLVWKTRSSIIGGFTARNMAHSMANVFRWDVDVSDIPEDELLSYFETYAIKWVVVTHDSSLKYGTAFRRVFQGSENDILELARPVSFFEEGTGRVVASLNRIQVSSSPPDEDLVLRFHWLRTMGCMPDCTIRREQMESDPVGFIRVPAPHPAEFVIKNTYRFP
jgi:hypothetical protein